MCISNINVTYAIVPDFVRSIKQLRIKSLHQRIVNKTKYIFDGAVEVFADQGFHLCADCVELDKSNGTLIASKRDQGPVSLENNEFVILADSLFLDFFKKTGYADNISIHVDEGYLSASRAEKKNDIDWYMENMVYTPCDEEEPHWHFKAQRAMMHGSYLIKASNLIFKVGKLPLFMLPRIVIPIMGKSTSGFLMPKFSYETEFGFGVKQEYYWRIHRHADTTLGVDWHERRGIILSDEFRWARSLNNFTVANCCYAVERRLPEKKNSKIIEATTYHYWISGKDFRPLVPIFGFEQMASLARIDFGTDKQIGYTLSNVLDDVDNAFYNSCIFRSWLPRDLVEVKFDNVKTNIKTFSDFTDNTNRFEKKENNNLENVCYFPRFEWNTSFKDICWNIKYRHNVLFDQVFYRQEEAEYFFFNSQLVNARQTIPFNTVGMLRFDYAGNVHRTFVCKDNLFKFFVKPHAQVRSHLVQYEHFHKNVFEDGVFCNGAYRLFLDYGAEWALPESILHFSDDKYMHYLQPILQWNYVPKFYQNNWFYIDRYDRTYPQNEISLQLRNNVIAGPLQVDVHLSQGFDFYKQKDIFYLRRGLGSNHLLPLSSEISFGGDPMMVSFGQEHDWDKMRLLQSEIHTTFFFNKFHVALGYLFQNEQMQATRCLLSNIPHFLTLNLVLPLSKSATLCYDSQFYSEKDKHYASLSNIKPLLHRIRLDYSGHCWGFYVGFEQKQYRKYGVNQSENIFVFSLHLDSLGSFAKKFKGIPAIKRME